MLQNIFCNRSRIFFLILFIVEFFRFRPLPPSLKVISNSVLLAFIVVFVILAFTSQGKSYFSLTKYGRYYNLTMILLLVFIILNCISCSYYRHQSYLETLKAWSPILILYLYYPLSLLPIRAKDWEWILEVLFIIVIAAHAISTFFPNSELFLMSSGQNDFLKTGRVRIFSNVVLWLGSIISFNKWVTGTNVKRYSLLFFVSLFFIVLSGFRIMLFAELVSCAYIFIKVRGLGIKQFFVALFLIVGILYGLSNISQVRERWDEMLSRNESENFENEDYVRAILINYYYTDYFKSTTEMVLGSGMVERKFSDHSGSIKYPSAYSKEMSEQVLNEHLMPIDVGLLGLSWEAGIPAVLLIVFLCVALVAIKQEDEYMYIRAWGIFLLLISLLNPRLYYNHNMIYTVIVWVILVSLKTDALYDDNETGVTETSE